MKTTRKILYLITGGFLIMLIFTFSNCKDNCPGYPPGGELVYDFHSEDSLKIPYTGHDTLTFLRTKDSIQDTVVFIGQGKNYYKKWLRYENEESDCEYSVWAKGYTIDYIAQNLAGLKFKFSCLSTGGMGDDFTISIKDVEFNLGFWLWEQSNGYYDHITLNGQIYLKVQKLIAEFNSINNRLYYNFEYGIIRIELDYLNEKYQLIN